MSLNWFQSKQSSQRRRGQRGGQQKQVQSYASSSEQIQKTANMQMFVEAANAAFETIHITAKMAQNNKWNDDAVNSATDGSIFALNMFAVTCSDFIKDNDFDAINLAKKTIIDKWESIKLNDFNTYKATLIYRNHLLSALNGSKNIKFNQKRVNPSVKGVFEQDVKTINETFSKIIGSRQSFDSRQESFKDPETNKLLKKQQDSQLNEYMQNKQKYNNNNNNNQQQYIRPKQSDFYFRESGKKSQFKSVNINNNDQKEMEYELFSEPEDAYNKLSNKYQNAVLKLSKRNPLKLGGNNKLESPIPVKILAPKNKNKISEKIRIRPAYPWNNQVIACPVDVIVCNVQTIKQFEHQHIQKHGKLGYQSIVQQENLMDCDNL